jgi:sulfide:quinone oxidoreductase
MDIRKINDEISVAPQITVDDLAEVAAQGFRTVINNRPDGEATDQASATEIEAAAHAAGLAYYFVPAVSGQLTPENVAEFGRAIDDAEGPVLAYCRTGTRSATLWALSQAGNRSADDIIGQAASAGYDLGPLRRVLEQ